MIQVIADALLAAAQSGAQGERTENERTFAAIQREVDGFNDDWVREHLQNDHMVTLDHKAEQMLLETLVMIKTALQLRAR